VQLAEIALPLPGVALVVLERLAQDPGEPALAARSRHRERHHVGCITQRRKRFCVGDDLCGQERADAVELLQSRAERRTGVARSRANALARGPQWIEQSRDVALELGGITGEDGDAVCNVTVVFGRQSARLALPHFGEIPRRIPRQRRGDPARDASVIDAQSEDGREEPQIPIVAVRLEPLLAQPNRAAIVGSANVTEPAAPDQLVGSALAALHAKPLAQPVRDDRGRARALEGGRKFDGHGGSETRMVVRRILMQRPKPLHRAASRQSGISSLRSSA
jgi:hypothetical protein